MSARAPLGNVVAVVGCDGSGKTTLVADLVAHFAARGRAERRYMGLISGEFGEAVKRLPWLGRRIERGFAARARRAQDMKRRLPGPFTALVMFGLSVWRAGRLRRLAAASGRGGVIVADRWPQAEVPGFDQDGPGLAADRADRGWLRRLAAREQRLYERMAATRPALVIRLDIDADTAHARKPDHPRAELAGKSAVMPLLRFNGAAVCALDARRPYTEVRAAAIRAAEAALAAARAGPTG